jgi:hypothetical protein
MNGKNTGPSVRRNVPDILNYTFTEESSDVSSGSLALLNEGSPSSDARAHALEAHEESVDRPATELHASGVDSSGVKVSFETGGGGALACTENECSIGGALGLVSNLSEAGSNGGALGPASGSISIMSRLYS